MSKVWHKDVSDFGKGLISDFFGSNRSPKLFFPKIVLGCLVCLTIFAWIIVWELSSSNYLELVFFDVGQGDSIFIETAKKHQILIDGGPTSAILEKLAKEMAFYDRTIDLIILTHPERDHLFGLLEVLKRYKVKNILWTGIIKETAEWQEWKRLIEKEGAEIKIAQAGQRIIFSDSQNSHDRENFGQVVFFNVLHPFENLEGQTFENSNDTSIVAELVFEDISFLFTGDISKGVEKKLIKKTEELSSSAEELSSSVLKVAHHGSKTSSSLEFLEKASPEIAVISVGENNYGHPNPEVLANLGKFAIQVLITKELGDIKIFSNGKNLKLKTQNAKVKTTNSKLKTF